MVVSYNFQDILDQCTKAVSISLPVFKQNGLKIEFGSCEEVEAVYNGQKLPLPFATGDVFEADISQWRRLTADDEACKPVYEVTFDVKGSNFTFKPGDTIGIIPHNMVAEVDAIIDHLDLAARADLTYSLKADPTLKGVKIPPHVSIKSTLRHVLTHCLDLRSVIKKLFILALSRYTKDETERKVLEFLCSKEGSSLYTTHVLNRNMCIVDIFNHFKSCKPPIEVLLAHLPRLLPRPYSIVNSGLKDVNVIKICFSVMDTGHNRKGLTTGWLEQIILEKNYNLEDGIKNLNINNGRQFTNKVPIYMRKNMAEFYQPDIEIPILLIGPGTGVSPYIGFLEEREILMKDSKDIGKSWLIFGCRSPKLDFIYEKELNRFVQDGILNRLSTTFSRVDNDGIKYVQDALFQEGEEVIKMLTEGAHIFVCGDLKTIAVQIKEVLVKCLVKYGNKTQEDAAQYILDMQRDKRYFVDIWS